MKQKIIVATFQNERTKYFLFSSLFIITSVSLSTAAGILGLKFDPKYFVLILIFGLITLVGIPALLSSLIHPKLNTKIVLDFADGKPVITSECFIIKTVYKTPFEYDATIVPLLSGQNVAMYFKLSIFGKGGRSLSLHEQMINGSMRIKGIEIEPSSDIPYGGVLENVCSPYPGNVWEIFQALENYPRGQKNTKLRLKSDEEFIDESPFQNSKNWV